MVSTSGTESVAKKQIQMNVTKIIFLLTGTIIRKLPRKLEVLEGENAVFCVEVENDDMEIHWFKDGLKLHETHQTILKSFGKTHILVFVNVAYQDSGVVTFVAGRSKTSSRLKVKGTLRKRTQFSVLVTNCFAKVFKVLSEIELLM